MVNVKVDNGYFPKHAVNCEALLDLVAVDALKVGSCDCNVVDETESVRESIRVAEHLMFKMTSSVSWCILLT